MTYTFKQLEDLWASAGGNKVYGAIAAAVALAESSGNPDAVNVNTNGSVDRGLWQINSVHGGLSTFDPAANARAAVQISGNGTNWNPWVTYVTGAYKKFLQGGTAGSGTAGGGGGGGGGGLLGLPSEVLGLVNDLDHALGTASRVALAFFSPSTYVRLAVGLIAVLLLVFGMIALGKAATA